MAHKHRKRWRNSLIFLVALWIILLAAALILLSTFITPLLKNLQNQGGLSTNWSGYVASSDPLFPQPVATNVNGSWIVPQVSDTIENTYSAAWIGIGGQLDNTLIQAGTHHQSINGNLMYIPWYELWPADAIAIPNVTVSPGDKIVASIDLIDSDTNLWSIMLQDVTKGQTFQQNFNYNASRLTAEWVMERPSVNNQITGLANFGSIAFTDSWAKIGNVTGTISSFPYSQVVMTDRANVPLVTVSPLSPEGSSFTVTYINRTAASPNPSLVLTAQNLSSFTLPASFIVFGVNEGFWLSHKHRLLLRWSKRL